MYNFDNAVYIYIFKDALSMIMPLCRTHLLYTYNTSSYRARGSSGPLAWPPAIRAGSDDMARYLEGFPTLGSEAYRETENGDCTLQRKRGQ